VDVDSEENEPAKEVPNIEEEEGDSLSDIL